MAGASSHRSAKRTNTSGSRFIRLQSERKKLKRRLDHVDQQIGNLKSKQKPLSRKKLTRLLDQLATLKGIPPLPLDFSRADLYADHD